MTWITILIVGYLAVAMSTMWWQRNRLEKFCERHGLPFDEQWVYYIVEHNIDIKVWEDDDWQDAARPVCSCGWEGDWKRAREEAVAGAYRHFIGEDI